MVKTAEKEASKAVQKNGQADNQLVVSPVNISIEDAAKALQDAEVGEKDSAYLEMEPGEEKRVVFLGWEEIPGMGDKVGTMVPAASFVTDGGKKQINADAVVVSYFQKQKAGVARRVVCTGIVRSKNGFDYKIFDFYELKAKKA